MKDILDGEEKGAKLDVLKELLGLSRSAMKDKLPKKGKGIAIMSISVSKPKGPETTEDVAMPEEKSTEEMKKELPEELSEDKKESKLFDEPSSEDMEVSEQEPENEDEEEELESKLPEPKIPSDVMELVKLMLQRKLQK